MSYLTIQTKELIWLISRQGENIAFICNGNIRMVSALFLETFIDFDRFLETQSILVTCLVSVKEYKNPSYETVWNLIFIIHINNMYKKFISQIFESTIHQNLPIVIAYGKWTIIIFS